MIFIRNTISSEILEKHIFPNDVASIIVELNFRKCKWLITEHTLSDCHKLVLTVLKTAVPRSQPKEITYRVYKQFKI